mmetsp:Transcript_40252/g.94227  ORF Transcript_40252/g.94227 Transcript_40252/m.94227 type:complete len:107 (-) Transcript_40252:400-720(-)
MHGPVRSAIGLGVSPTARRLHHFLDVSERYTGALLAVDDTVDLSAILNIWKESDVARYGRHVDTPVEHTSRSRLTGIIIADAPFSGHFVTKWRWRGRVGGGYLAPV